MSTDDQPDSPKINERDKENNIDETNSLLETHSISNAMPAKSKPPMKSFTSNGKPQNSNNNGTRNICLVVSVLILLLFFFFDEVEFSLTGSKDRSDSYKVKVIPNSLDDEGLAALPQETFSYLAMIDAGSSGCRAHVYRYGKLGSLEGPLYVLPQHVSKKVKPGLSSFANNPQDAGVSLTGLVDFIKTQVPEADWELTPIWLKATAGLRMLEPSKSDAVLNSVRTFLSSKETSPFLFRPSWASVISGNEEGGFGWIAFNYLKKIIGPKKSANSPSPYAVIEMGGASAQVSQLAPTQAEAALIPPKYQFTFTIEGAKYELYTHSYLGFGAEQAREGLNRVITKKSPDLAVVEDPCLQKGQSFTSDQRKEVYQGPAGAFTVSGISDGLGSCAKSVVNIFTGKDAESCSEGSAARHLAATDGSLTFACTYQPPFVTNSENFLVFENFFYMASALGVEPAVDSEKADKFPLVTTPSNIKAAADKMCGMDLETVTANYPMDSQGKENNVKFCFVGSYAYEFLVDGLGLSPTTKITTQKEVGKDVEIEWALGAAYKEAAEFLKRTNLRPT